MNSPRVFNFTFILGLLLTHQDKTRTKHLEKASFLSFKIEFSLTLCILIMFFFLSLCSVPLTFPLILIHCLSVIHQKANSILRDNNKIYSIIYIYNKYYILIYVTYQYIIRYKTKAYSSKYGKQREKHPRKGTTSRYRLRDPIISTFRNPIKIQN